MEKKLYRDEHRKTIGGVCAGLAEYFDIDIAIVRALFLLTFIFMGTGLMVYIVLWIVLPKKGYNAFNPGVDYRVPPQDPNNPFGTPIQPDNAFGFQPQKKETSRAGLIIGVVLIFVGASFLLHELRLFHYWHFGKLWPAVLVIVGFALMVSGKKQKPWEQEAPYAGNKEDIKDDTLGKDDAITKDDDLNTPPTV
ncbi:MAG: PspC protein [Mucilaginibacter sp.]|nr:PspC protein [Mucilaginibacter sp.]